ncbi:hypothetical protein [Thiohalorhabdus methylotrophus]|uniref:Outer membrane protein beta-barrel domain-containing protein n=1 Tax=Thiohalorhabdus methylotrophus TaxID=3242694 RepID=A0ABV4TVK6_9GAMM
MEMGPIGRLKAVTKVLAGVAVLLASDSALAGGYLGVGAWDSQFLGEEHDRKYESDTNRIKSLRFGWQSRDLAGIFGDVNFDDRNRVRDLAVGLVFDDYTVHVERGEVSGDIVSTNGSGGTKIGEFESPYLGINLVSKVSTDGAFYLGVGYQQFAMPILFEYGTGGDFNDHIQDDNVKFQHLGLGVYYDPIRDYLMSDRTDDVNTWYFSTNGVWGISKAVTSDAPEMQQHGVDGQEYYLFGQSGSYELGWFFGSRGEHWGITANIGYHLRAITMVDFSRFPDFPEPEEGEILPPEAQFILHGPRAGIRAVF